MFELRDYQKRCLDDISKWLENPKEPSIVVAPTGAGKSILIANAAILAKGNVLVLQPSRELLVQNYNKYIGYGYEASIFSASAGSKEVGHKKGSVTFGTIGSVINYWKKFEHIDYIIVDECHKGTKKENQIGDLMTKINPKGVLGMTATPVLLINSIGGSSLKMMTSVRESIFKKIIHVTQIDELVSNNYWSKLLYKLPNVNTSSLRLNSTGADFTLQSLRTFYRENELVLKAQRAESWLRDKGYRHTIIFASLVEESYEIKSHIPHSEVVHGGMPMDDRKKVIKAFESGLIRTLINVDVLSIGYDFPKLDSIVLMRPTQSVAVYYQQIGRGVRIDPDKSECCVIDLSGNYEKFGRVEDFKYLEYKSRWCMISKDKVLASNAKVKIDESGELVPIVAPKTVKRINVDYKLQFGKYIGLTMSQVWKQNKGYVKWLASDKYKPMNQAGRLTKEAAEKIILNNM